MTKDQIYESQKMLNAIGFNSGSPDGIAGSKTKSAVLAFQRANSVYPQDGILGPITFAAINKVYSSKVVSTTTTSKSKPVVQKTTGTKSSTTSKITDAVKLTGMSKMNKIGIYLGIIAIAGYAYFELKINSKKKKRG